MMDKVQKTSNPEAQARCHLYAQNQKLYETTVFIHTNVLSRLGDLNLSQHDEKLITVH